MSGGFSADGRHPDRPDDRSDADREREEQEPRIVVRDRRRIDPETGQVRRPAERPATPGPGAAASAAPAPPDETATQLAERTADLQRLTAEYANYRKRVERDRTAVVEVARAGVLSEVLPVLDDIDRAREHGDLSGAFKAVAGKLTDALSKLGLAPVGTSGDPFDPTEHEAVMHQVVDDVSVPTCVQVLRPGYRVGERLLRPAMVAVAEPSGNEAARPDVGPGEAAPGDTAPDSAAAETAAAETAAADGAGPDDREPE
ncbi:MAG: nucleotide exchange factor GrpE [Mycobacteriales bacterium]